MRVELVDGVGIGMVVPEIFFPVDAQAHARHAGSHDGSDVCAAAFGQDRVGLNGHKQRGDVLDHGPGRIGSGEAKSLGFKHAAIGLHSQHMLVEGPLVRLRVRAATH